MKKAIATIEAEIGTMTIYYNGENENLTAETDDTIETIDYTAKSEEDAVKAVHDLYSGDFWGLQYTDKEIVEFGIKTYNGNAEVYANNLYIALIHYTGDDLDAYGKDEEEEYKADVRDEITEACHRLYPECVIDEDSLEDVIETIMINVDWYFD